MIDADKMGPLKAIVVAAALNGVIGKGGDLAWKISDDLKWFKKVTIGKPIIMGRKTFESIGRPLPDRINIVISRQAGYVAEGCRVMPSLDEAMIEAESAASANGSLEVCVIGGADIYRQTLPEIDRIYFTKVLAEVEGDVEFPSIDAAAFRKVKVGAADKKAKNQYPCEFFILDRCAAEA